MLRKPIVIFLSGLLLATQSYSQNCPANIGFEQGDFAGWQCSTGMITQGTGEVNSAPGEAVQDRHTILTITNEKHLDPYGNFPVFCPNGSNYSIKLGNSITGRQTEGISYTFTIPPDQDNYSIIYNYAVVFQNPGHPLHQQPKFTANVFDQSTGTYIGCSSFTYTAASSLPGFKESPNSPNVFYKEWTPVTIKLSGYAGKTIRLEFNTYDCAQGGHFGYAYVDVNQNCTSPIGGNVYCANTEKITLTAPFGFSDYNWYTADFSQKLGSKSTLEFNPVPVDGTKYALVVTPYPEQGCVDTLYTTAKYSPEALDLVVTDNLKACISNGADLTSNNVTAGSGSNLSFSYFNNEELSDYVTGPKKIVTSGKYYVLAENVSGCKKAESLDVHIEPLPEFSVTQPPKQYRPGTADLTKLAHSTNNIQYNYSYWYDSLYVKEIRLPQFVDQTGRYFIKAESTIVNTCSSTLPVHVTILDPFIFVPNAFSPNGDGSNDQWRIPQLAYYPSCTVEVYNRTGRLLYRSLPGYTKPWDGLYEGQPLPIATYYYVIKLNDELPLVSGSVTIVR